MGSGKRTQLGDSSNSPGPGQYTYYKIETQGHGYTMGSRLPDHRADDIPGPGTYHDKGEVIRQNSPSYKIGTDVKVSSDKTSRKDVPGPGQYSINPK